MVLKEGKAVECKLKDHTLIITRKNGKIKLIVTTDPEIYGRSLIVFNKVLTDKDLTGDLE